MQQIAIEFSESTDIQKIAEGIFCIAKLKSKQIAQISNAILAALLPDHESQADKNQPGQNGFSPMSHENGCVHINNSHNISQKIEVPPCEKCNCDVPYNQGFLLGNSTGYNEGYVAGQKSGEIMGKAIGIAEGYNNGYHNGCINATKSTADNCRINNGFSQGKFIGYKEGIHDGFEHGKTIGLQQGYSDGHEQGFYDGRDQYCDYYDCSYNIPPPAPKYVLDRRSNKSN